MMNYDTFRRELDIAVDAVGGAEDALLALVCWFDEYDMTGPDGKMVIGDKDIAAIRKAAEKMAKLDIAVRGARRRAAK